MRRIRVTKERLFPRTGRERALRIMKEETD
jgi:hypothetical protein